MYGFYKKRLFIDLNEHRFEVRDLSDEVLQKTLGGKGLATHLLLEHNPPGVDPLSPENHLVFCTGPLTGTLVWGSCRHGVYTKSPQTGCYSESYAGGTAAEYIARTGFDIIVISGAARHPVWLEISDQGVHFHSAAALWGKTTYATEDIVKERIKSNREESKGCGVLTIGPAGENLVAYAVIENDYWRSSGRTGVGAVMGSKKIKAIAYWGNSKKETADPDGLKAFSKDMAKKMKDHPGVAAYKEKGTPMMVDIMNDAGCFPTRYLF